MIRRVSNIIIGGWALLPISNWGPLFLELIAYLLCLRNNICLFKSFIKVTFQNFSANID